MDTNIYNYFIDLHSFEVKKPSEVEDKYKTLLSLHTTDKYKGIKGTRGRAEACAIRKHISHLKYVLKHTLESDERYVEINRTLTIVRAKLPTITKTNYPEWFI